MLETIPTIIPLEISVDMTITDVAFEKIAVIPNALKAAIKPTSGKNGKL